MVNVKTIMGSSDVQLSIKNNLYSAELSFSNELRCLRIDHAMGVDECAIQFLFSRQLIRSEMQTRYQRFDKTK
ncbi:hypothetical protein [Commensalibacter sp. Nvir]|uniref:hypothetical protein n=1 Tax=Commensalibacter sp. Nvir TaxID=3069817 RepID=UPI0030C82657